MNDRVNILCKEVFRSFLFRAFIFSFLLISVYGGCSGSGGGVVPPPPPPTVEGNKLNIQILDAFINDNRQCVATIKITDDRGNPLQRSELASKDRWRSCRGPSSIWTTRKRRPTRK